MIVQDGPLDRCRMPPVRNPNRSPVFRLITIAAAGLCSFVIGLWGLEVGFGSDLGGMSSQALGAIVASLCALAAAGSSISYFAGVDESADYVFSETQIDKLTGLNARTAMVGKIAEAAVRVTRTGKPVYLIDIDIDRFKHINDAIGYAQGDELIRGLAGRLKAMFPKGTELGRIGAGEFAILYPDGCSLGEIDAVIEMLVDRLSQNYRLSTHVQSISLSIGVVAMPKDGVDPVLLLRRSNLALQHARSRGVGGWAVYEPEMGQVAEYRQWIESELGAAFDRGDFELYYQPQMNMLKGKIVGYEALIRWRHPERGMISPMEFIPVAEETGIIEQIGRWVLRQACIDARQLPEDCFVAVNISPVQFTDRDFVATVRSLLAETGMKPARLELEITETAMMRDRERAARILSELAALGISVAVDDFGTGYSNLSYLLDFSFSKLKIDRSFVNRLEKDQGSGAVVSTIVGLSRALGVRTIAEGVETESQALLLKAAGCEVAQGYLYGKPEPLKVELPAAQRSYAVH